MTSRVIDLRLRKIEKQRHANRFDRLSEEELNDEINQGLAVVCFGFPSVNAAAEAFRASPSLEDHHLAEQLDWYIGYVAEERAAGRMN
ncbi:hypothetical protein [Methylobacterium sp. WL8]|uniref:hypothetical protein n=1 Tax=Methylobacterium sp. WL8 TaxID=2603899 RepID=UPI0011C80B6F|nr:hypothetical protein [Methylobacterium sp. WL8]TXN75486.1 hypothetical protein FV234_25020 [Methylobacterium sp. WL8]